MDSHAKSSTISRVYRCCCNFFRQNPRRFPWFCFGMCLFPEENQQPVLGGNRFSEEKWQFSFDVKQKHTFYRRKSTKKKFAKVSPSNNNYSFRIIQPFNNNNTIWRGSVLTGEEPPPHSGELKHALSQAGGLTQSQLSRPMSSGHHISMEHRLRRKQLNSDTDASNKKYLKETQVKRKEETFSSKKWKKKMKNIKKSKNEEMNKKWEKMKIKCKKKTKKREKKKVGKKGKEGPKGYHPRWVQKLNFHIRTVKRNRNEIETQKNQILSTQQRKRKWQKMTENERKWKKMKENERKWKKMKEK